MNNQCVLKQISLSYQPLYRRAKFLREPITETTHKLGGRFSLYPTNQQEKCCFQDTVLKTTATAVQRQVTYISYRPQRKTLFGDSGYPYATQRLNIGGKFEGQLGGSLAKPNNF